MTIIFFYIFSVAQWTSAGGLVHESPVRQLQQVVPHVAAQPATLAFRQPGVFSGAPLAAGMVSERLRLLSKVFGGTR